MGYNETKVHPCYKHGACDTRLYHIWRTMKHRCTAGYANYGARGITLYSAWKTFTNFRDWANGAGYTDTLTIDRIDVNKSYYPENCQWIPRNINCCKDALGSLSSNAKLHEDDVIALRAEYAKGQCSQYTLAKDFGVSRSTIQNVINGKTWRHIL